MIIAPLSRLSIAVFRVYARPPIEGCPANSEFVSLCYNDRNWLSSAHLTNHFNGFGRRQQHIGYDGWPNRKLSSANRHFGEKKAVDSVLGTVDHDP
jgi:hypothetical protein